MMNNAAMDEAIASVSKSANDTAKINAINNYCSEYQSAVFKYDASKPDNGALDFFEKSLEYMERITKEKDGTVKSDTKIHLWSKILLYLSKKNLNYNPNSYRVPENYPKPNNDYERLETVIILLNRFFNTMGLLQERQTDGTYKTMTNSAWTNYKIDTLADVDSKLKNKVRLGGMCFEYDDTTIFADNYNITKPKSCNINVLKNISNAISSPKIANFKATIKACVLTDVVIEGGKELVRFRNPTAITDFLFNGTDNKFGFELASADNYRHKADGTTYAPINVVNEVLELFVSSVFDEKNNLELTGKTLIIVPSVSFALDAQYNAACCVYKYIYDTTLNWTIKLPVIDYSKIQVASTNNMYPISKINTYTYATSNLCLYDMFK